MKQILIILFCVATISGCGADDDATLNNMDKGNWNEENWNELEWK